MQRFTALGSALASVLGLRNKIPAQKISNSNKHNKHNNANNNNANNNRSTDSNNSNHNNNTTHNNNNTPGLHNKIPAQKIFARGWVAQEPICS